MDALELDIGLPLRSFRLELALALGRETFALVGPSGAGKTTVLRAVAGLARPERGRVALDGEVLFDSAPGSTLPPEDRRVGFVFQDYALFPHMTVAQNVAYGVAQRRRRAARALPDRAPRRRAAGRALGRRAPARRARTGARARSRRAPPRRAAVRARPAHARGAPTRAEGAARRARPPGPARDARLPRRGRARRPRRGARGRPRSAGRDAVRAHRRARRCVRRELHRRERARRRRATRARTASRRWRSTTEASSTPSTRRWETSRSPSTRGTSPSRASRRTTRRSTTCAGRSRRSSSIGNRARVQVRGLVGEVTAASAERLGLAEGDVVMASFKAAATRLVERAPAPTGR